MGRQQSFNHFSAKLKCIPSLLTETTLAARTTIQQIATGAQVDSWETMNCLTQKMMIVGRHWGLAGVEWGKTIIRWNQCIICNEIQSMPHQLTLQRILKFSGPSCLCTRSMCIHFELLRHWDPDIWRYVLKIFSEDQGTILLHQNSPLKTNTPLHSGSTQEMPSREFKWWNSYFNHYWNKLYERSGKWTSWHLYSAIQDYLQRLSNLPIHPNIHTLVAASTI